MFIDSDMPSADRVADAGAALRSGTVVAIPTDTLYGLAANPFDAAAVGEIFRVKGRADDQALPLIAADREQVVACLGPLSPAAERLAARFWPGPLTLLVPAARALAPAVSAGTGRVGVRVPRHAVARALCAVCGTLLTATSANRSGEPPTTDPDVVARTLLDVGWLIDSGRTPGGPSSTVVDVTGDRPVLVRAGAVPWEDVLACLDRA